VEIDQFKQLLLTQDLEYVAEKTLLSDAAIHFDETSKQYVKSSISGIYSIDTNDLNLWVVGSAKLGFSITEKKKKGITYPRFRPFTAESDIDIAIVSPKICDLIWRELSLYGYKQYLFPWNSGVLGDYLVYGWFRPDKYPKRQKLRRCDDWWDLFARLSSDSRLGRRQIRGGLYYSYEFLKQYQIHSLADCRLALEVEK